MQDLPPPFPTSAQHVVGSTVGGCGGFFLTDMFDDNDLFAHAASQHQVPTKVNPKAARPLPAAMIQEVLEIDETVPNGLRWKTRPSHHFTKDADRRTWNARFAGRPAGSRKDEDSIYYIVSIDYVPYQNHRIVFFLANSIDPGEKHVDHINPATPFPNVAANLRLATNAENLWNSGKRTNNTSGVTGVNWHKRDKKWRSYIMVNAKCINLGYFTDYDDAVAERKAAELRFFGRFSYDASQKSSQNAA